MMQSLRTMFGEDEFIKTSEEFSQELTGGIWMTAEPGPDWKGLPVFDYYEEADLLMRDLRAEFPIAGEFKPSYDLGVLIEFGDYLKQRGWYTEWYDAGTMILWEAQ